MMSRNIVGFFAKPARAVAETTLYTLGATAIGSSIYRAGNYAGDTLFGTDKQPPAPEQIKTHINQPNHEDRENSGRPGMSFSGC
ncbi:MULTISPECIES: hypothetical protein [Legionella]|uniref:Uncharacterized protein n=1 Tax=Legionella steelei TaxID=947033 RepID=A0A0W0ZEC9_9GAMM|nr:MULTISPECIES: hypothetical protein [Legionella]KTD67142.1 hypothetical protein Lste_3348 [Legionella steelei]MBN9226904.1 hypothetical protein [Legionella steelei]OJW14213.1 MAG: hypothetical protein BGO44_09735 [Legionella sp. 39-23]